MSKGAFTENRKCVVCQTYVNEIDATWEAGQPYHDKCYGQKLARDIESYEKKMRRGTLSMVEAKELVETKELYVKMRNSNGSNLSSAMYPDPPVFKGNTLLSLQSINRLSLPAAGRIKELSERN